MKRILFIFLAVMMLFSVLSACNSQNPSDSGKLSVVTTIFPQYDFARQIAGDHADITMLLKPGGESHSYEPTPQDIKTIQDCDLFIYVGGENDTWVESILASMGEKKPRTLKLLDCVSTVTEELVEGMEHEHEHGGTIDKDEIKDRSLSDFAGSFKTVFTYYENGTLDEHISGEAEEHDKSFAAMKQEFLNKYKSEYDTIEISGNTVSLKTKTAAASSEYQYAGYRTVKNDEGDITGVWYTYEIKNTTKDMPKYLAFNDHETGGDEQEGEHEDEVAHFHLRYGNESAEVLLKAENWVPTYFEASASSEQIKEAVSGHRHGHGEEIDEHVWTSPKNAIEIVKKITAAMSEEDGENAPAYAENSEAYIKELEELDASFRQVVSSAKRKTVLFGDRFPFRYFADEYGLTYHAAFSGCSTETEASAKTIAFLINKVKDEKLPVVFTIEFSNGKIADSICNDSGAKKMILYSCHNVTKDQLEAGVTYLSMMKENVESLRAALN